MKIKPWAHVHGDINKKQFDHCPVCPYYERCFPIVEFTYLGMDIVEQEGPYCLEPGCVTLPTDEG